MEPKSKNTPNELTRELHQLQSQGNTLEEAVDIMFLDILVKVKKLKEKALKEEVKVDPATVREYLKFLDEHKQYATTSYVDLLAFEMSKLAIVLYVFSPSDISRIDIRTHINRALEIINYKKTLKAIPSFISSIELTPPKDNIATEKITGIIGRNKAELTDFLKRNISDAFKPYTQSR